MREKCKEFWNILKWALVPAGICAVILLLNFLMKGIWPFGERTVAGGDVGQSFVPIYTHFYDVLTGKQGIGWTPFVGIGNEAYESEMVIGVFNPFTWIMFLGGRGGIIYWMSLSLILRVGFSAVTAYFCLAKLFPKNRKWLHIILAVTYGLSGYMFKYYTNIFWVDVAGLFPLLILSLKYMFETRRIAPFVVVMALALLNSYNIVWMFLVFLGLIGFTYIFVMLPSRKEKVGAVLRIMAGCLLAAGMTAVTFFVSFLHLRESYRGEMWGRIDLIGSVYGPAKAINVLFYSLPILGVIIGATHIKEDKKVMGMLLYGFALSWVVPTIFEPMNLIWQGGTYQAFPMRYGFIAILLMAFMVERYFEKFFEEDWRKMVKIDVRKRVAAMIVLGVIMMIAGVAVALYVNKNNPVFYDNGMTILGMVAVMATGIIIIMLGLFGGRSKRVGMIVVVGVTLIQAGLWTGAYVGFRPREGEKWTELYDEGIMFAQGVREYTEKADFKAGRWKDVMVLGGADWGVMAGVPTVETFFGATFIEQVDAMYQLGYHQRGMKTLTGASGGLLSDTLLGVKYYVADEELDEEIFEKVGETRYAGYLDDQAVEIYERRGSRDGIGFLYKQAEGLEQNELYRMMGGEGDIMETEKFSTGEENKTIKMKIEGEKEIYIWSGWIFSEIKVNGEAVVIPSENERKNKAYFGVDGMVKLGRFKNEEVEIELVPERGVRFWGEGYFDETRILTLDVEKYFKMNKYLSEQPEVKVEYGIDSMKIKVEATEEELEKYGEKLFLPVAYDEGWKVVSGQEYERVLTTFMSFELVPGVNEIEMRYEVRYLGEFMIVSGVSMIGFVGVVGWELYDCRRGSKRRKRQHKST